MSALDKCQVFMWCYDWPCTGYMSASWGRGGQAVQSKQPLIPFDEMLVITLSHFSLRLKGTSALDKCNVFLWSLAGTAPIACQMLRGSGGQALRQ